MTIITEILLEALQKNYVFRVFFFTAFCKKVVNCRVSLPFAKMTSLAKRYSHILRKPLKSGSLGLFSYYPLVK
jgi:hypothetical protein